MKVARLGMVLMLMLLAAPAGVAPTSGMAYVSALFFLLVAAFVFFWYGFACGKEYAQERNIDAARWRYFAASPQTALMLGSKLDPYDGSVDWVQESSKLADEARSTNWT